MHVHARLSKRSAELGIPVLPVVDVRKAVAAVFDGIVGPQQPGFDALGLGKVAASDKHVTNGNVPQHFDKQVIQIIAGGNALQERLVFFLDCFQVEPVQSRIVEKVALVAPHLFVHMLPFGARINVNLHGIEFEGAALTGFRRALGWFLRRADKPLVLLRIQHFLAVKREIEVVDAI